MSKAGKKLIAATEEALAYAKCKHKWVRLSTRVEGGKITATLDRCEHCGGKRNSFVHKPSISDDQ